MKDDQNTKGKDELSDLPVKKDEKDLAPSTKKIRDLASAYRKKKGKAAILPNPLLGLFEQSVPAKQDAPVAEAPKDKKPFSSLMQDTIDSWADIKKQGYRPLELAEEPKKKSLEELFAEVQQARADRERLIAETAPETVAFKARGGGGRTFVVSPDTAREDRWRMTHFDDKGPVGHTENLSFPQAMEIAHEYGANLKDRLPPDAFAEGGGVQPITGVTFDNSAEAEERLKQKLAMWAKQYEESQKPQTVFPKAYDPEGTARLEEKRGKHLVHYSQSGKVFPKLDPKFFGEGRAGQERERGNIIPRTYYYEAESSPEAVVRSGAKHRYVVPRPDRILDLASDEGAHWVRRAGGDMSELEQMLKDHGFAGYKNSAHPELPHAVALFHEQDPIHITPKFAEGGRVMMQAGGNPGFQLPPGMTEEDLIPSYTAPTDLPQPTPVPTQQATAEAPTMAPRASGGQQLPAGMTEDDLLGKVPSMPPATTSGAQKEIPSELRINDEGVPMYDMRSGQPRLIRVPHTQVVDAVSSQDFSLPQGMRLPVVRSDGQIGDVPAEQFKQALEQTSADGQPNYRYIDPHEAATLTYKGTGQQAIAFAEGLAEGTLGALAPVIESSVLGVPEENILGRAKAFHKTKAAGEMVGFGAPLLLTGGAWVAERAGLEAAGLGLSKAAQIAAKAPLPALASKVGSVVKIPEAGMWITHTPQIFARNALEGLVFSASDQLGEAYLDNPDQTATSAMLSLGLGAVLGGAFGVGLSGLIAGYGKLVSKKVPLKTISGGTFGGGGEPPPGASPLGGEPPPSGPSGQGEFFQEPPATPQEALRRELERQETSLAREYTPETIPPDVAPPPSGIFTRPAEPKVEGDLIPGEPATSAPEFKSEERQLYEEITGRKYTPEEPIPAEEQPSGLYIEEQRRWVAPEDVEAYKARDPVIIDKYHPELNIGEILGKENLSILQRAARNVVRAKRDAREIEHAWVRSSRRQGVQDPNPDEIPIEKLTDEPHVHYVVNHLIESSPWASRFFPYSKQRQAFNQLQENNIRALLGEFAGKDNAHFGEEYQRAINQRFATMYESFKAPYEWINEFLGKVPISQETKALKTTLEKLLSKIPRLEKGKKLAFNDVIADLESGNFRTLYNLKDYLSKLGKLSRWGEPLPSSVADRAAVQGYRDVWVVLKQFEEQFVSTAIDNPAVREALSPNELLSISRNWTKKKEADAAYKAFAEELKKIAVIAGVPKSAASSVMGTMDYFRTVSPDDLFKSLQVSKLNVNELRSLQKNFSFLSSIIKTAEKQRILQKVYAAKDMSEKSVAIGELKKLQKDTAKADFVFGSEYEKEILEDIITLHKPADIKNWSNTEYTRAIMANLGVLGMKTDITQAIGGHTYLKGARETMKLGRGLRGKPKKYAEGGMVEADMPTFPNSKQAFVSAVNRPPEMQEAHRIAGAIVKGEKMISNSVKSIFDPKSTYRVAPPSPKMIDVLKQHLDQARRSPEDMANVGSTVDPRLNTAVGQTISSAANFLKSLEPPKQQNLPLDSGAKAPPSAHADIYNHVLRVAEQPLYVLEKIRQGTLIPEEVGAVKTIYPILYQRLQNQITEHMVDAKAKGTTIPYRTKLGLSAFLGSPLDTTMSPESIQSAQPMQQNQPPQGAQTGAQPKRSTSALGKMATMAQTPGQARMGEKSKGK